MRTSERSQRVFNDEGRAQRAVRQALGGRVRLSGGVERRQAAGGGLSRAEALAMDVCSELACGGVAGEWQWPCAQPCAAAGRPLSSPVEWMWAVAPVSAEAAGPSASGAQAAASATGEKAKSAAIMRMSAARTCEL